MKMVLLKYMGRNWHILGGMYLRPYPSDSDDFFRRVLCCKDMRLRGKQPRHPADLAVKPLSVFSSYLEFGFEV